MRVSLRAIKLGARFNTCDEAERTDRYAQAMDEGYKSMLLAGDGKLVQNRRDGAFKPSEAALDSMRSRMMDPRPLPAVITANSLYNGNAQTFHEQSKPFDAGNWQGDTLACRIRVVEQCFKALALGDMPRSRGVPRRGGRSGIRIANEVEELNPIAPMAALPPSSSSSEQEFLVLQDTYQTFRLRIPSRLIRSDVIVNFSVYLSEEAPGDPSSSSPASASIQGSDILLGDMNGMVYRTPHPQDAMTQNVQPQQVLAQEGSAQAASVQEILPPFNCALGKEEGHDSIQPGSEGQLQNGDELVIWLDSPSPEKGKPPTLPSHPA